MVIKNEQDISKSGRTIGYAYIKSSEYIAPYDLYEVADGIVTIKSFSKAELLNRSSKDKNKKIEDVQVLLRFHELDKPLIYKEKVSTALQKVVGNVTLDKACGKKIKLTAEGEKVVIDTSITSEQIEDKYCTNEQMKELKNLARKANRIIHSIYPKKSFDELKKKLTVK